MRRRGDLYGPGAVPLGPPAHLRAPVGRPFEIEIRDESSGFDDKVVGSMCEPWESWDFDLEFFGADGERSHRARFEPLTAIEIRGAAVDFWYLDVEQSDLVARSGYKARVVYADVPSGGADSDRRRPVSTEVTFSWDPSTTTLDEDDVRAILSTFRTEPCAEEYLWTMFELFYGVEFDE